MSAGRRVGQSGAMFAGFSCISVGLVTIFAIGAILESMQ
jgi:hypothetical protein